MKKLLVVLTVLCLVFSMAAMAEENPFTIRNGVQFGMTQDEVTKTEGDAKYEVDTERTRGSVTFTEVEYENATIGEGKGDIAYLFLDDKLVACTPWTTTAIPKPRPRPGPATALPWCWKRTTTVTSM